MLQDFAILHRRKPRTVSRTGALASSPVWETCLRTLVFTHPGVQAEPGDDVFVGHRAYAFLLEIVCGLHSPITGETEVMGQFKIFATDWAAREPRRIPLVQKVLNDAKALRARHLSNLGTQSYGSWLRKHLAASRIHVVGAGHLAQEILPYLEKQGTVVLHTRRPVNVQLDAEVRALSDLAFDEGALVIAAPLSAAEITTWLNGRRPKQIFDLRDDSATDVVAGATSLDAIFRHIEQTKARLIPIIEIIRAEILERALRLAALEKVRPQGWDDLCA